MRTTMANGFKSGDIVVSRVNGPFEAYMIGRLEPGDNGNLRFTYVGNDMSRQAALEKADTLKPQGGSVWPFP